MDFPTEEPVNEICNLSVFNGKHRKRINGQLITKLLTPFG